MSLRWSIPHEKVQDSGPLLCPSAHTAAPGARLFGVQVRTESGDRQLAYLTETHPITEQVMELAGSAAPHEVLRVAAHCIEGQCPIGMAKAVAWRPVWRPCCRLRFRRCHAAQSDPPVCGSSRKAPLPACAARRWRRSSAIPPTLWVPRWRSSICKMTTLSFVRIMEWIHPLAAELADAHRRDWRVLAMEDRR